jgi:hypothetical protein
MTWNDIAKRKGVRAKRKLTAKQSLQHFGPLFPRGFPSFSVFLPTSVFLPFALCSLRLALSSLLLGMRPLTLTTHPSRFFALR